MAYEVSGCFDNPLLGVAGHRFEFEASLQIFSAANFFCWYQVSSNKAVVEI